MSSDAAAFCVSNSFAKSVRLTEDCAAPFPVRRLTNIEHLCGETGVLPGIYVQTGGCMSVLKGRDFLKLLDFEPSEIEALLNLSAKLKEEKKSGIPHRLCEGKNLALIFEKTSTRTRCAFEVAARDLGMGVTVLDTAGSQIGKKKALQIRRVCFRGCLTVLSTGDMRKVKWKNWRSIPLCRFSTV